MLLGGFGPGEAAGICADPRWDIPKAARSVVVGWRGRMVSYLAGNDMPSGGIMGEVLLYLPPGRGVYGKLCRRPCLAAAGEVSGRE